MSTISSLSTMVSALMASQTALNTTAHNLANADTDGYTRQQVLFRESNYQRIGNSANGVMSVGTGTDIDAIRQVRDIFLDQSYREESGRLGFYESQTAAVNEIETILGEIGGEAFSDIMDDFWTSLNELAKSPESLETRANFIQNSVILVEKANLIMEQLNEYQSNLNQEVIDSVDRINEIGEEIDILNNRIRVAELGGDTASDYRDQRNLLLDELSEMVDVSYKEDGYGTVLVSIENVPFVTSSGYNEMGLIESGDLSGQVEPYWSHLDKNVFNLNEEVSSKNENDIGSLKGKLVARGTRAANYTDLEDEASYEEIEKSIVMTVQAQFDNLIHGIVTMVNNIVAPNTDTPPATLDTANAPYGLDGSQGAEVFSRIGVPRYDETTGEYIEEDPDDPGTLYSAGNIKVNEALISDYNLLALSSTNGADGDTTVIDSMLDAWEEDFGAITPNDSEDNFQDYYTAMIGDIATYGSNVSSMADNQESMVNSIENERDSLLGVSSDEELGNMLKFQHAYNAASRVVTVLDSMIEQIVTSLGTVGR